MYTADPAIIPRVLDICQELKVLSSVLECRQYNFSIELAAIASKREYLNIEKWLRDHLSSQGSPFFRACLDFLNEKASRPDIIPLPVEVTRTFLRILHELSKYFLPNLVRSPSIWNTLRQHLETSASHAKKTLKNQQRSRLSSRKKPLHTTRNYTSQSSL
jgi:CCR4-NOT transcription complex subunit 1 HEAT repeat